MDIKNTPGDRFFPFAAKPLTEEEKEKFRKNFEKEWEEMQKENIEKNLLKEDEVKNNPQ